MMYSVPVTIFVMTTHVFVFVSVSHVVNQQIIFYIIKYLVVIRKKKRLTFQILSNGDLCWFIR
uniref:Uncharacterized protein n=1 Tax=Lepeophtheirus salmonis TaxID=72036 RepID=A0A0K2SYV5_LEPSM